MNFTWMLKIISLLSAIAISHGPADATQLTFEQVRSDGFVFAAGNGGVAPQDYGDRVTGSSQAVPGGTFTYGNLAEGFTPNVVVSYGPNAASAQLWENSFGDLLHIVWNNVFVPLEITLAADPGFVVKLHDFDLAGWPGWDYTINSIQILDGENNLLFSQNNVHVEGDNNGPRHSHFDFPSVQARTLTLRIDSLNLGGAYGNIGLDNIRFSQSESGPSGAPNAVPEPSAALLLAAGFFGTLLQRRRKK